MAWPGTCNGTFNANLVQISNSLAAPNVASARADASFTLYGAPMQLTPITGQGEKIRNSEIPDTADTTVENFDRAFADTEYSTIPEKTPHILRGNEGSTIRIAGKTCKLNFICVHNRLLSTTVPNPTALVYTSDLQISLVFNDDNTFVHVCIPVQFLNAGDSRPENLFLKKWLYKNPGPVTKAMTINELVNFSSDNASYWQFDTCLRINSTQRESDRPRLNYLFLLFNTPLFIFREQLNDDLLRELNSPLWNAQSMNHNSDTLIYTQKKRSPPTLVPQIIFRRSFSAILQFMIPSKFKYFYTGGVIQYRQLPVTPIQEYFETVNTGGLTPIEFITPTKSIAGDAFRGRTVKDARGISINNIKCYPIDLWKQVDDDGNVVLDNAGMPMDVKTARGDDLASAQAAVDVDALKEQQDRNTTIVVALVIGLFVALVLIFFGVYIFAGRSTQGVGTPAPIPTPAPTSLGPSKPAALSAPPWAFTAAAISISVVGIIGILVAILGDTGNLEKKKETS